MRAAVIIDFSVRRIIKPVVLVSSLNPAAVVSSIAANTTGTSGHSSDRQWLTRSKDRCAHRHNDTKTYVAIFLSNIGVQNKFLFWICESSQIEGLAAHCNSRSRIS